MLNFKDITTTKFAPKVLHYKDNKLVEFDLGAWICDNQNSLRDEEASITLDIIASASGLLINNRVYPAEEWRKSASKFKDKPVLKHHDMYEDAIGRIQFGQFVPMSGASRLKTDYMSPGIQGRDDPSGIVKLKVKITDPDAITKVKDERLLHTSQGSRASTAICSICGNDYGKGTVCDHDRGVMYKDEKTGKMKLCYWIIRNIMPKEISAVNEPAYEESRIIMPDMEDSFGDSYMNRIMDMSDSTPTVFGGTATSLLLTDTKGSTTPILFYDEKKYEILTLSEQSDKNSTEVSTAEQSEDTETTGTINMADTNTKEFEEKIKTLEEKVGQLSNENKKLSDQVAEFVESNKTLRETNDSLTAELEDNKSVLKTLQDEHMKLTDGVTKELITRYVETALVAEDQVESVQKQLLAMDIDTIRFMVNEAERLNSKTAPKPVEETIDSQTNGDDGDAGSTGKEETKPVKPIFTSRNKNSLRRKRY